MFRAAVLALILPTLVTSADARTTNVESRAQLAEPASTAEQTHEAALVIARFGNFLDLDFVPHAVVERLVRWQLGIRDLVRGASDRLAALAQNDDFRLPDLTILTTFPLPTSDDSWATSGFGWRDDPMRHRRKFHSGADVRAQPGTPVFAAGDGEVIFAGRQGGYGNIVMIDHGGGVITRYAHLRRILTAKGDIITAGKRIGQVGSTGRTTGPHLHFEVRLEGNPVDPTTALTVAELQRDAPEQGRIAAFALSPEMQSREMSDLDPPRSRTKAKKPESRPDRPGRVKRVRPVS